MKNLLRNPFKLILVATFVAFLGIGMSISINASENTNTVNLESLASVKAQVEDHCHYHDKKNRTLARGCKKAPGWLCELC